MSIRSKGLVFAMEEAELDGVAVDDAALAESELVVDGNIDDAAVVADDTTDINDSIDDTTADGETLSDIKEVMEKSVEDGEGLDETSAQIAEVAIEAICNRLGIHNAKPMPAMESFGSKNSRLVATKVAIIALEGYGAKIWAAIQKALVTALNFVKNFFAGIFNTVKSLKKYAAEVAKNAAAATGDASGNIKNKTIATAFGTAGKSDVMKVLEAHTKLTTGFEHAASAINAVIEVASKLEGKSDAELVGLSNAVKTALTSNMGLTATNSGDEYSAKTENMINGHNLIISGGAKEGSIMLNIDIDYNDAKDVKEEIPALTKAEIADVCASVNELLTKTETFQKSLKTIERTHSTAMKVAEVLQKADESGAKAANKETEKSGDLSLDIVKKAKNIITSAHKVNTKLGVFIPLNSMRACRAALKYAADSSKSFGGASAAAEPEEKKSA